MGYELEAFAGHVNGLLRSGAGTESVSARHTAM